MKKVNQFARVFDTEKGQLLISKCIHPDTQKPAIEAKTLYEEDGVYCSPAMTLQYSDRKSRDKEFDGFEKLAEDVMSEFDNTLKELLS